MIISRKNIRGFWLKLHLILALIFGLLFAVLGLTGSSNVFYYELREWGLPKPVKENTQAALPLDAILQSVKAQHPQRNGGWSFLLPGYGAEYLLVEYPRPEETREKLFAPLEILIDPYTGQVADQRFWGQSVPSMLYELHAALMLGELGKNVGLIGFKFVSGLGAALFVLCLSGLYLWWPRNGKFKQALTVKHRARPERLCYDMHKIFGFYGSLILLILAFTGFSFAYSDVFLPIVRLFSPVDDEHLHESKLNSVRAEATKSALTISEILAIADRVFPNAELRMVNTPDGADGVFMVAKRQLGEANRKRPRSKVWIDQYNGKVLAVQDPNRFTSGETFFNVLWPLHDGQALGIVGRIVWCCVGFIPLGLYVTGILWWLYKGRKKQLV
ncbi:MAG: PepSY domain-containing protein [Methylomonas sp.]|jgi:uncharacterized iron-regulated membrane protein|uniref:PepSY-associated TM helix domain-containing protein n=1 Tax=Methylomonas sp. TaxID=418 RepID=UPI0025F99E09|nr:PepSY-associated TM helix domain-containing protein [Methylomonas sp.]MCK9605815.1 PepSY domain-containing protein [Methylomonas sp.]